MDFLFGMSDTESIIRLSRLTFNIDDKIGIIDDPLKILQEKIVFINYINKKVKVKIRKLF